MHISFFRLPPTMVGFLSVIYFGLSPFFLDHNFLVLSVQPLPFPALKRFMYPRLLSLPIGLNLKSYSYIPLDFSDWTIIYIFQLLKSQNFQLAWPKYTEFFSCSLNIFKNLFFFFFTSSPVYFIWQKFAKICLSFSFCHWFFFEILLLFGFPGGPMVKDFPASAGDIGLIPGPGGFHMLRGN